MKPKDIALNDQQKAKQKFIILILKGLTEASDIKCLYNDGTTPEEKEYINKYYPEYVQLLKKGDVRDFTLLAYIDKLVLRHYISSIEPNNNNFMESVFNDPLIAGLDSWLKDTLRSATCKILAIRARSVDKMKYWLDQETKTMSSWRYA